MPTALLLRSRRYAAETRVKYTHILLILPCQRLLSDVPGYVLVPLPWQMAGYPKDLPPATVLIA